MLCQTEPEFALVVLQLKSILVFFHLKLKLYIAKISYSPLRYFDRVLIILEDSACTARAAYHVDAPF